VIQTAIGSGHKRIPNVCANPWNCSPYAREAAATARRAAPSIQELQVQAQSATGIRERDNFYSSALKVYAAMADTDGPLALAKALEAIGAGKADEIAAQPTYQKIPATAYAAAALIVRTFKDAEAFRRIALLEPLRQAGLDPARIRELMYDDLFWGADSDDDAVLPGEVRFAGVSKTPRLLLDRQPAAFRRGHCDRRKGQRHLARKKLAGLRFRSGFLHRLV
jgi:hypothetical protein